MLMLLEKDMFAYDEPYYARLAFQHLMHSERSVKFDTKAFVPLFIEALQLPITEEFRSIMGCCKHVQYIDLIANKTGQDFRSHFILHHGLMDLIMNVYDAVANNRRDTTVIVRTISIFAVMSPEVRETMFAAGIMRMLERERSAAGNTTTRAITILNRNSPYFREA